MRSLSDRVSSTRGSIHGSSIALLVAEGAPLISVSTDCGLRKVFFVRRQILAEKPRGLRRVFIDWMDIDARIDPGAGSLTTRRMLSWHDTLHTAMTLRRIAGQPDSPVATAGLVSAHLVWWVRCLLHHGQAVDWFEAKLRKVKRVRGRTPDWAANDGWRPGETGGLKGDALAKYAVQLDKLHNAGPRLLTGLLADRFAETLESHP